jgi:hypothetical protein
MRLEEEASALVYRHLRARGSSLAGEFRDLLQPVEGRGPTLWQVARAWTAREPLMEVDLTKESSDDEVVCNDQGMRIEENSVQSDQGLAQPSDSSSDSGVDDPYPVERPLKRRRNFLRNFLRKNTAGERPPKQRKKALANVPEHWAARQDYWSSKREDPERWRKLPVVFGHCGISRLYVRPSADVVGPLLENLCRHVLALDVSVSPLNQASTNAFMMETRQEFTEVSIYMPEMGGQESWRSQLEARYGLRVGKWVEWEDAKLLARNAELGAAGLLPGGAGRLAEELNKQNGRKGPSMQRDPSARNILGLYIGQDLPHRLAFESCQRLVELVTGDSILRRRGAVFEVQRRELLDNPRPRRPTRTWSLEEDAMVMEAALRREGGDGFVTASEVGVDRFSGARVRPADHELVEELDGRRLRDIWERWRRWESYLSFDRSLGPRL